MVAAAGMLMAAPAPGAAEATRHLDAVGAEACAAFGRAMRDFGNGLVTERELRLRLPRSGWVDSLGAAP